MVQNIQTILDKWLEIDFYYVADKIGFIKKMCYQIRNSLWKQSGV